MTLVPKMHVYRIVTEKNAAGLLASGKANRWNLDDQKVIYAGSSRALAALEWLTKSAAVNIQLPYKVLVIALPKEQHFTTVVDVQKLPADWRNLSSYPELQKIGSDWYISGQSLILKVPSAVIPAEFNYVISLSHRDFAAHVSIVSVEDFPWDKRLLR